MSAEQVITDAIDAAVLAHSAEGYSTPEAKMWNALRHALIVIAKSDLSGCPKYERGEWTREAIVAMRDDLYRLGE